MLMCEIQRYLDWVMVRSSGSGLTDMKNRGWLKVKVSGLFWWIKSGIWTALATWVRLEGREKTCGLLFYVFLNNGRIHSKGGEPIILGGFALIHGICTEWDKHMVSLRKKKMERKIEYLLRKNNEENFN